MLTINFTRVIINSVSCLTKSGSDSIKKSISFEIKVVDNMITRCVISMNKDNFVHLTLMQVSIMSYIFARRENYIYQRDLEEIFKVRRSTISGVLKTMEKNKLVERIDSQSDARVKKIVLTNYAISIMKEVENSKCKFEEKLKSNISLEDLEIFYKVINQIKENITN